MRFFIINDRIWILKLREWGSKNSNKELMNKFDDIIIQQCGNTEIN